MRTTGTTGTLRRARLGVIMAAAAAIAVSGCLVSDVTETWYVDAAGAVTWVIEEKDVRSDANSAIDRRGEEDVYWLAVQQERHPVAAGLLELSGVKPRTIVLRAEPPYTVRTEARFTGLDALGQRLIACIGATGTSIVTHEEGNWAWVLSVRDPSALDATAEPSEGVSALMNSMDKLKVVLIAGRFERADGFSLSADRRVATFNVKEPDAKSHEEPVITLRLVWKAG